MAKWKTFKHNGVYFPPEYQWKKLWAKIKGEKFQLDSKQEEMLYAWAKKINTPYVKDPVFQKNFLSDFKKLQPEGFSDITMDDIDISEIAALQGNEKNLTKEEKKLWDVIQGRKQDFEEELRELEALRGDPECPQEILLQEIDRTKNVLAIIETANKRWG